MRINRTTRVITDDRKISTGYRSTIKKTKHGVGLPVSCDHFVMIHPETGVVLFPELVDVYGDRPTEFFVTFPSSKLSDVFDDQYNLWNKANTKTRTCNGAECTHILNESVTIGKTTHTFESGQITDCICEKFGLLDTENPDMKKYSCKLDCRLFAYIIHPDTFRLLNPLPYYFSHHSKHSADNLFSMLSQFPNLKDIPFRLSVTKKTTADRSFTIWKIVPDILPETLVNVNRGLTTSVHQPSIANNVKQLPVHNAPATGEQPAPVVQSPNLTARDNTTTGTPATDMSSSGELVDAWRIAFGNCQSLAELKKTYDECFGKMASSKMWHIIKEMYEIRKSELKPPAEPEPELAPSTDDALQLTVSEWKPKIDACLDTDALLSVWHEFHSVKHSTEIELAVRKLFNEKRQSLKTSSQQK